MRVDSVVAVVHFEITVNLWNLFVMLRCLFSDSRTFNVFNLKRKLNLKAFVILAAGLAVQISPLKLRQNLYIEPFKKQGLIERLL